MRARILTDTKWAENTAAALPPIWQGRLLRRHARKLAERDGPDVGAEGRAIRAANIDLRETVGRLKTTSLPLGADDADIRERAARLASECRVAAIGFCNAVMYEEGRALPRTVILERNGEDWAAPLRVELRAIAMQEHTGTPWDKRRDKKMTWGGVARMMCESWWRRQLRAQFARAVEGAAISLGYVNRARECYVSDESVKRRQGQNKRNAQILESVTMENEHGQQFTLAELAARSTANRAIRRGELMTRIAGFEAIAKEAGHDGLFLTMTCPSRMHKWATVPGTNKVRENGKYDGTTPREAQRYLSRVFSRIRSALARRGLSVYGFRIAEPNHDGTPHWHLLLFAGLVPGAAARKACPRIAAIFRRYALASDSMEAGARLHRVKAVRIDWERGTAAGYIAKYVSKNIDGLHVEKDLFGNDGMHTSARVEAWAATWGIKQFQQIGGAPVGVWRELRRVKELPDDAPEHLRQAWEACNKVEESEDGEGKKADFGAYCDAQGGVFVGRAYRIRLADSPRAGEGRYGEPLGAAIVGVSTSGQVREAVGALGCFMVKSLTWLVQSVRYAWRVIRGIEAARSAITAPGASDTRQAKRSGRTQTDGQAGLSNISHPAEYGGLSGAHAPPRTRVINCTPPPDVGDWWRDGIFDGPTFSGGLA